MTLYRASPDYQKLAAATKRSRGPWLDRVATHFGGLSIAAFDNPKVRPIIRQWRNQYAETPRTADTAMQVLSRVCAHAVDPLGKLNANPCEGIKALYTVDRSDKIWTEADIVRIKQLCIPEIIHVIDLAAATGLRWSDLRRVSWSHIHEDEGAIRITTAKSEHRREAVIPLYDGLREVLARIPKRSTSVLTNSKGRPWSYAGFAGTFSRLKNDAELGDLHFHDLRGTAATKFYTAGLSERVVAEIMGWAEQNVANIIRRYVDHTAATRAVILQLNKAERTGKP